jgi:competence protein ComEC
MKVLQFPLVRITTWFVLGILFSYYEKCDPKFAFTLVSLSFLLFIIVYLWLKKGFNHSILFGITCYFMSFTIGVTTQTVHTDYFQKDHYVHNRSLFEKPQQITIVLREKLKSSNYNDRYVAIVKQINDQTSSGSIILNIQKDSLHQDLEIGTPLRIQGILYQNNSPNNPNGFDYGKYLENKQIYAQLYTDVTSIKTGQTIQKDLWYYASRLRSKIIRNLENSNFNKAELHVAVALILGQQQEISDDIIKDYQFAGAVHILSVSGLHIGFILLFVTFILKPLPNTRKGSFVKLVIILLSLSLFGILAGLAPSVVRSVTMFSFVAIGNHLRRSVNIYHTLIVSILLILLFQPSFLFDVGFQLSYIALFFILWLQPLLASIWSPKLKASKYLWDILTVSFAAQIGSFPLSIYYFHQFPGLFFVTNLIIIPLLGFIMVLGVLVMVLAAFNFIPFYILKTLEWSIHYLNKTIHTIASLEQFIIKDIPFNTYLLISSYLLVLTTVVWFKKPHFTRLIMILSTIILVQIACIKSQSKIENQQEWIVFNVKRETLITERNGTKVTTYTNHKLPAKASKNKSLTAYLVSNFSSLNGTIKLQNTAFFNGNKILILDSMGIYTPTMKPDILLLTQSPKLNLERLLYTLKPKIVVADASNFKTVKSHWKLTCLKQRIPFHDTSEKGFFRLN